MQLGKLVQQWKFEKKDVTSEEGLDQNGGCWYNVLSTCHDRNLIGWPDYCESDNIEAVTSALRVHAHCITCQI
jgi:hypothetical protein